MKMQLFTLCLLSVVALSVVSAFPAPGVENGDQVNLSTQNISIPNLYQGDIRRASGRRSGLAGLTLWPNRIVPYKFEGIFEAQAWARSKVHMAMAQISALTCVRFEPAQTFNTDFLAITSAEDGCWSYVGKIGGRQALNLGNGCISAPVAVHEIIHALGFGHEQSRPDRDKYISFKDEATALNYDKDTVFFVTGFPYDFASAMHYGANGEMFPRDPAVKSLGAGPNSKNTLLSGIDAAKINTLYGCDCP